MKEKIGLKCTVAVLQPSYLPWLGYIDQMLSSNIFVFYDDVAFDKHGWRNRNRIKTATKPLWLTVPIFHKGRSGQKLVDVCIDNNRKWSSKHVKTLQQNYQKAPFYEWVMSAIEPVLAGKKNNLVDLNLEIIKSFQELLGFACSIYRSSELNIPGKKSERLLHICEHFNSTHYLTGNAASAYLDEAIFAEAGIDVIWHHFNHPVYQQLHGRFIPYLSTIDLLFNHGPGSIHILKNPNI